MKTISSFDLGTVSGGALKSGAGGLTAADKMSDNLLRPGFIKQVGGLTAADKMSDNLLRPGYMPGQRR